MINLLPPELSINKGFAKAASTIKSITLVLTVVFLFTAIGISALFIFSSLELKDLSQKEEELKEQIKARESTETKLILLKDRLAKIKSARSSKSSTEELTGVSQLLSVIGGSSRVPELTVDTQKAGIDVIFSNSSDLAVFLENLPTLTEFKSIIMTSFGFNPTNGYFLSLRLTSELAKGED